MATNADHLYNVSGIYHVMIVWWAAAAVLVAYITIAGGLHDGIVPNAQAAVSSGNDTLVEITSQAQLQRIVESAFVYGSANWQPTPAIETNFMWGSSDLNERLLFAPSASAPSADFLREGSELSMSDARFSVEDSAGYLGSVDHSTTNIQVAGVDEPDYLKNDGEYLYMLSDNVLSVIDLWPAEEAHTVMRSALDVDGDVNDMFLSGDRLVLFYTSTDQRHLIPEFGYFPVLTQVHITHALIVDITDRENPDIVNEYAIEGAFMEARMIGDHAYFVTDTELDYFDLRLPVLWDQNGITQTSRTFYIEGQISELAGFVTLAAIDVQEDMIYSESFLTGDASTFYVSTNNFYLAYTQPIYMPAPLVYGDRMQERFEQTVLPLLPSELQNVIGTMLGNSSHAGSHTWRDISVVLQIYYDSLMSNDLSALFDAIDEQQAKYDQNKPGVPQTKTIIHKISIDGLSMQYEANGEVPGDLLNQFSMDEHDSKLRVATTASYRNLQGFTVQSNGVFVMDASLEVIGDLEGVAPAESIFAARFMGERLYLVTFRQIDPFFVIDLSEDNPRILGELKLPGFSDYLHPYGDDYVIGIGRDTDLRNGWASALGVKIAVFDVRNVTNPVVLDDHIIGKTTSTHSAILTDHKAFFFDPNREILAVPIVSNTDELGIQPSLQPWGGFYVFNLDMDGMDLAGTIEHSAGDGNRYQGFRTFYINDVLYTVSDRDIKMNDIITLESINHLEIGKSGGLIPFLD